ncbi:MAG: M24 family metallopeptidase, partial [Polymorphobacter sp.]
ELASITPWPTPAPPISRAERDARIEAARTLLFKLGAQGLLIGAGASLDYFTGVPWGGSERLVAMLLPRRGLPIIICPAFERGSLDAALAVHADVREWQEDENPSALVAKALAETGIEVLAVDPQLPFFMVERLRAASRTLRAIDAAPLVDACRRTKSPAELALMRQAKRMTLQVQRRAAAILRVGITATEVRAFLNDAHRAIGAAGSSFAIVQFGRSTAFPHGLPGESVLADGDMVLIDTGCTVGGYNSDITRSYVFGTPSAEQRRIWDIEAAAQQAAFDAVRPGVACEAIDWAARHVLQRAGLGPDYRLPGLPHRTGHGIGLSIHEAPYLVRGDTTLLEPGMCFSNEPMIVIPDRFGVRLEDHFFVTETGAEWFTSRSVAVDKPFG